MQAKIEVRLNDGNVLPVLGLGTAGIKIDYITDAINCGYRHFDTAYIYKNEQIIGEAMNEAINAGEVKIEDMFFVTKVWPTFYSIGRVIKSAKQSIEESGLNYIDLLQLHWPFVLCDSETEMLPKLPNGEIAFSDYDIIDVYRELEEVKRMGLAKSIGVSNFNSEQIERIVKIAEFVPITNQVECHPYLNQEKLIKLCERYDITITACAPFGGRNKQMNMPSLLEDLTLKIIAEKYSKSVAQIILRWQTQRGVIVIPGGDTKQRIKENIDIFDIKLSDEDMAVINSLNRNFRFIDLKKYRGIDANKEYPFDIEF